MVGLIQKLLLALIESTATIDAVKEVKRRAGVPPDKEYSISGTYDDEEWQRLLAATCDVLKISPEQAEEAFAEFFYKDSLKSWPTWFQISKSAQELLERQPRIHNGFATSMQNPEERQAINEKFHLETFNKELVMHYRFPNRLCGLYKALALRIIDHYGDQATLRETLCLKKGDSACEIHICWN